MICLIEESLFLELASKMIPHWNILTVSGWPENEYFRLKKLFLYSQEIFSYQAKWKEAQ